MKAFVFRCVGIAALCISLFGVLSCGNDQALVSIVVSPQNVTIAGVDCTTAPCQPTVQYKAIGFYNHGGKPKDITDQVVWSTNAPTVIQFQSSPAGLLAPTGNGAGTNLGVTATVYSNPSDPSAGTLVFGNAVITVNP
jgi:hypothetical protein